MNDNEGDKKNQPYKKFSDAVQEAQQVTDAEQKLKENRPSWHQPRRAGFRTVTSVIHSFSRSSIVATLPQRHTGNSCGGWGYKE